ncbi:MAG TPA: hypothetical protein VGM20_01965 [Gemmatimonadales bacterium]|jgi:hypothetical protein
MSRIIAISTAISIATMLAIAPPAAAQATPIPPQAAAAVATAAAVPSRYSGNCPAPIDFIGRIIATAVGMTIDYQWERSNGSTSKVQHVTVTAAARNHGADSGAAPYSVPTAVDRWKVGFPARGGRFWERVHIIAPVDFTSPQAQTDVDCGE